MSRKCFDGVYPFFFCFLVVLELFSVFSHLCQALRQSTINDLSWTITHVLKHHVQHCSYTHVLRHHVQILFLCISFSTKTFVLSRTREPAIESRHLRGRTTTSSQQEESSGHLKHHSWMMMHSQRQLNVAERQEAQKIWHQGH